MSAFLAFLGTFLLSLFVALLAALQLADYFGAGEEFMLILIALPAFVLFSLIALVAAGLIVWRLWLLNWVAVLLGLVALAPIAWPALAQYVAGQPVAPSLGGSKYAITTTALEFTIPALFGVLVQWGLIRRRWLLAQGDDDLSLWPWFTTVVAGLAILNPIGLDILGDMIAGRPPAALRDIGRIWTGSLGILIAMVLFEYYIRGWVRRRRQSRNPPAIEVRAAAG